MPEFKGKIRLEDGDGLETTLTVDSGRLLAKAGEHEIGDWAISELSAQRRNSEFLIKVEGEELVVDVADPIGLAQVLGVKEDEPKGRRVKKPRVRRLKRKERTTPEVNPPPVAAPVAAVSPPVFVPEPPPVVAPVAAVSPPVFVPEPPPVVAPAAVMPPVFVPEPPPVVAPAAVMPPVFVPESPPVVAPVAAVSPPVFVPEPAPVVAPAGEVNAADEGPSPWQRIPMRAKLIGLGFIGFVVFFFVAPSLLALLLLLAGVATLFLAIAAKNETGSGILPPPIFATNAAIASGFGSVLLALVIMVIT
jgi:hypothetical protein